MADCCENSACTIEALVKRQSTTLKIVLVINAFMFFVELAAGLISNSTSLLSDSLDNLGDAMTYGVSIYAVDRGARAKAKVAMFKGTLILLAGLFVLAQVAYRLANPVVPIYETMGLISILALLANSTCLWLLWKHREEDVNMSSVWECSRNDIASNLSVFVAAAAVWASGSGWPDVLIALALAAMFVRSAIKVFRSALTELNRPESVSVSTPVAVQFIKRKKV